MFRSLIKYDAYCKFITEMFKSQLIPLVPLTIYVGLRISICKYSHAIIYSLLSQLSNSTISLPFVISQSVLSKACFVSVPFDPFSAKISDLSNCGPRPSVLQNKCQCGIPLKRALICSGMYFSPTVRALYAGYFVLEYNSIQ